MGKNKAAKWRTQKPLSALLSSFLPLSPSISPSLCSVSTTASEVTTQLSLAVHLRPWQRLLSLSFPSLPLSSNQTCNYSVGQHAPHWPTVKYDHQFGPYPFIAILPPPMGTVDVANPQSLPTTSTGHFTPPIHLTPLNCHIARRQDEEYRQALSPRNELLSLLTLDWYPLELTSANHLLFFFFSSISSPPAEHPTLKPHTLN